MTSGEQVAAFLETIALGGLFMVLASATTFVAIVYLSEWIDRWRGR